MKIGADQAQARVEAYLGRPAQDSLEAAVVLEAWGGLPSRSALELGPAVVDLPSPKGPGDFQKTPVSRGAMAFEGLALSSALLATVTWSIPLAHSFGWTPSLHAWDVALPLSLGVQWGMRRRLFGSLDGFGGVGRAAAAVGISALACFGAWLAFGAAGALAAILGLAWVAVLAVVKRGWGFRYTAVLLGTGAVLLKVHMTQADQIALLFGVATVGLAIAVASSADTHRLPGPWRLAIPSAIAGALVGSFIVLAGGNPKGMRPDLAMLTFMPALLGTLWGALHLAQVWDLIAEPFHGFRRVREGDLNPSRVAARTLDGAVVRLILTTLALDGLILLMAVVAKHQPLPTVAWLLASYSAMGLVGMVVVLLEAFGRPGWAILTAVLTILPLILQQVGVLPGPHGLAVAFAVAIGLVASVRAIRLFTSDPHLSMVVAAM